MKKYDAHARRKLIVETAKPTPRSEGGRVWDIGVYQYPGGHTSLTSRPRTLPMMLNDDDELIAEFTVLVRLNREKMIKALQK